MKYMAIKVRAVCAALTLTFLGSLASAAMAQQSQHSGARPPNCTQSMIENTTWHVLFQPGSLAVACSITIAADGTITPTNCTQANAIVGFIALPSGKLTIDHACHVTGSIAYTICISNSDCGRNVQFSISAWRSADGSRLTGFVRWTCDIGGSGDCLDHFEAVADQQ
jgi:hypothetical protein